MEDQLQRHVNRKDPVGTYLGKYEDVESEIIWNGELSVSEVIEELIEK